MRIISLRVVTFQILASFYLTRTDEIALHFATGIMGPKARRKDWTDSSRDSLKEARERLVEVRHRSRITSV